MRMFLSLWICLLGSRRSSQAFRQQLSSTVRPRPSATIARSSRWLMLPKDHTRTYHQHHRTGGLLFSKLDHDDDDDDFTVALQAKKSDEDQVEMAATTLSTSTSAIMNRRMALAAGIFATGTYIGGDNDDTAAQAMAMSSTTANVAVVATPSLPWVKDPINPKRSSMRIQDAEALGYNLAFITYLTRFLLNFDPLTQQYWIDGARELPRSAKSGDNNNNKKKKNKTDKQAAILAIRKQQFSKLAASVELGIVQEFGGPSRDGPKRLLQSLLDRYCNTTSSAFNSTAATATATASSPNTNAATQERLNREVKEARRQLALMFGLLQGDAQPTKEITKLLATVDNGSLASVALLSDDATTNNTNQALRGFAPGEMPVLELVGPQAGEGFEQATVIPVMKPTGRLLRVDVNTKDQEENDTIKKTYSYKRAPSVTISPPADANGQAAKAVAKIKQGRLVAIELVDPGSGYTPKDKIEVIVVGQPEESYTTTAETSIVSANLSPVLEMAVADIKVDKPGTGYAVEKPIKINLVTPKGPVWIGTGYIKGGRNSFTAYRIAGDNTVRAFERALDEPSSKVRGTESGGSLPALPFTSKATSSQQLLQLFPQGFGLEFDPVKQKYFLSADQDYREKYPSWASSGREVMVPDFGPRGESPIERQRDLDLSTFLRFCLSGAICASAVHLVLTPLDVVKTKVQTNPDKYPKIGSSFVTVLKDEGPTTFFTGWVPTFVGNFFQGAALYAMTELIRRYLTDAAGGSVGLLEVPIILTAAAISSAVAATVYCPFEAVRIRAVAQPDYAPDTFKVVNRMITEEGIGSLINAIPVFLVKQVPYACVKFTIFDLSTEYLYQTYPAAQEDLKLSLLVSLVGGILGGVSAAFVSNPADAVISELKKAKSDLSPQQAFQALLDRAGVSALFKGLSIRMVFYSLNASLQFVIFDGVRFALGVGPDDLRLYLDVLGGALTERGTIV